MSQPNSPHSTGDHYHRAAWDLLQAPDSPAGARLVRIVSDSMAPFIRRGDRVAWQPCAVDDCLPGDILLVGDQRLPQAHRLIQIESGRWLTRGDANLALDAPLDPARLLGKVIAVEHGQRSLDLRLPAVRCSGAWIARQSAAWLGLQQTYSGRPLGFVPFRLLVYLLEFACKGLYSTSKKLPEIMDADS